MAVMALGLLVFDGAFTGFLDTFRGKSYDIYQMVWPLESDTGDVVLIEIDDAALAQEGRWPWTRSRIADLVRKIGSAKPTAFGIDILFPDQSSREDDDRLARAIAETRPILAMSLTDNASTNPQKSIAGWSVIGEAPETLVTFPGLLASRKVFTNVAGGLGMVRSIPDADGVTRSIPMVWAVMEGDGVTFWPSLSLELARQALGAGGYTVRLSSDGYSAIRVGERIVELTAGGAIWLTDTRAAISRVSAIDILNETALDAITGKIVILSVSATGFDSFHNTPLYATRPGAEIHALLTEQIMTGRFPYEAQNVKTVERLVFSLLAILLILSMTSLTSRALYLIAAIVAVLAAPFSLGLWAYHAMGQLYDSLRPTVGLALLTGGGSYFLYRSADARRRMISEQFARYLSPNVVKRLIQSDSTIGQSAERRDVTVLFMDMRGFTASSERLESEEIVETINRFLTIASEEIFRTDGTIDKFMGDAVMAFWNAPLDQPDHAARALDAVRGIFRRIETSNVLRGKEGHEPILLGAGIESGECSVGNFGSDIRYNYTVIGQAANLASRLETTTKTAGFPVLGGPSFAKRLPDETKAVGAFELAGFTEKIQCYQVLIAGHAGE